MRPRPEPVSKTHCRGDKRLETAAAVLLPRPLPLLAVDVVGNSLDCNDGDDADDDDDGSDFEVEHVDDDVGDDDAANGGNDDDDGSFGGLCTPRRVALLVDDGGDREPVNSDAQYSSKSS